MFVLPFNDQRRKLLRFAWNFYQWFLDLKKKGFYKYFFSSSGYKDKIILRSFLIFNSVDLFFIQKLWNFFEWIALSTWKLNLLKFLCYL